MNDVPVRDFIQLWCEDNGFQSLSYRLMFVPEEILEQLLFETPFSAEQILDMNGY